MIHLNKPGVLFQFCSSLTILTSFRLFLNFVQLLVMLTFSFI